MKKVIFEQDEEVIRLEDITDKMIIGLLWKDKHKSFLIKNIENKTFGFSLDDRSLNNKWTRDTNKEYIKSFLSNEINSKVFVFDSPKELARWLAE